MSRAGVAQLVEQGICNAKAVGSSPSSGSPGDAACSGEHFARLLVREDLPLDALQSVVDRLRVAVEILGHVLVGVALEVQRERLRLERREAAAEREDEALELLGRDDADGRVVHARIWAV